jgi:small-conductance mechanosensitive channel
MTLLQQINTLSLVEELLRRFMSIIPNIAGALAIIVIGWIIARILAKFLRKVLGAIGIDRLAERLNEIDIVHRSSVRLVPSALFSKIVYYFLLFIFLSAATDVLGMAAVSTLMNEFLNYIPYLLSAFVMLVVGLLLADFLRNLVLTTCESLGIPAAKIIAAFVFYFVFLNIAMITLNQAKIDTNFIQDNLSIILAGIVLAFAIGYGLAARPMVANLLSAYYNRNKVNVGDVISINGIKGEVIEKDNATLTLQAKGHKVIIPLNMLSTSTYEIHDA